MIKLFSSLVPGLLLWPSPHAARSPRWGWAGGAAFPSSPYSPAVRTRRPERGMNGCSSYEGSLLGIVERLCPRWLLALKRVHEGRAAFSSPSIPVPPNCPSLGISRLVELGIDLLEETPPPAFQTSSSLLPHLHTVSVQAGTAGTAQALAYRRGSQAFCTRKNQWSLFRRLLWTINILRRNRFR